MASLAMERVNRRRYYIRLNTAAADLDSNLTTVLEGTVLRAGADVAVVYRFDAAAGEFNAVARHTDLPMRVPDVGATLSDATTQWLEDIGGPVQGEPSLDPFFEKFPEVIQHRLERLLVTPLRGAEEWLGILTIGRSQDRAFDEDAIEVAQRSARLLSAVMERDSLQQKLAERKLVERAKGILQRRRRLSEEQAYLMLRNTSRRRRKPMAELAKEIIQTQLPSPPPRQPGTAQVSL
jgi:GAF domain-containing protein